MIYRPASFRATVFLAAVAIAAIAGSMHAQVRWRNCSSAQVFNLTQCQVQLELQTTKPHTIPITVFPPGGPFPLSSVGTSTINFVTSAAGILYPILQSNGPTLCGCPDTDWRVCCITLPPDNCCCDVC